MPLALFETTGFTPALAALDAMEKTAAVRVVQSELNDRLGVCLKLTGELDALLAALPVGAAIAEKMGGEPATTLLSRVAPEAESVMRAPLEYNPLIQQEVVRDLSALEDEMAEDSDRQALGLIETQGFTAVFAAVDAACKAAKVEVIGKEKLGGGYVTIVIRGDVAAVKAAVEAGQAAIDGLGKLIAAYTIARPSEQTLRLLPRT